MPVDEEYPQLSPHMWREQQQGGIDALFSLARSTDPATQVVRDSNEHIPAPPSALRRPDTDGIRQYQWPRQDDWFTRESSRRSSETTRRSLPEQRRYPRLRIVRFGAVATTCTLLQLLILDSLVHLGLNRFMADGTGFVLSAQVNFALSALFTWRDREPRLPKHTRAVHATKAGAWSARWAKFNATAMVALAVNELVFAAALHSGVTLIAASAAGILTGAVIAFSVNNFITFRKRATRITDSAEERRPHPDQIRVQAQQEGVAFFLPAFNEAGNLEKLVPQIVDYFYDLSCAFTVIIVDDGSTRDDTYETAERLADAFPGYVQVVHHARNMGYGAALQTGMEASLATGHGLIAFCDADDQFDICSFGTLLAALEVQDADLAVGYRIARADSLKRRLMGSAWHWLSSVVLGSSTVRDVDCGFKVFTRPVLADVFPQLQGDYAAVSPEILLRAAAMGYTTAEAGVTHRSRTYGRQTGSDLRVVVKSLIHLFQLRLTLARERRHPGAQARVLQVPTPAPALESPPPRDRVAWAVGLAATALSLAAYVVTDRAHAVLAYKDSISHMEIARDVVAGATPGLAQLGGVWLPLPHVLMLPFVWDTKLYYNGLAGTIPSLAAFVITVVLIYKLVHDLTGSKFIGIVAAVLFASNANMLYMQSTPMTEALLYCLTTAMIYGVQRWASTGRYQYLTAGGVAALFATLTRYEGWIILASLVLAVALIAWQRTGRLVPRLRRASIVDHFIVYAIIGGLGVGGWLAWNLAIFGNPIYFQDGQFAKPSLWVKSQDPFVGNLWVSFKTYWYAMSDNETWPLLLVAGLGLIAFLVIRLRSKRDTGHSLPVLSLLIMAPFYIYALYKGQRPLYVLQIEHGFSNVRFGLMMLLPTAIFGSYLPFALAKVLRFKLFKYILNGALIGLALLVSISLVVGQDIVTYNEPVAILQSNVSLDQQRVVTFLNRNYSGGRVLIENYGNERIAFAVPSEKLVYEGTYRQWKPALHNPAGSNIQWIVMNCEKNNADLICRAMTKMQLKSYSLVYRTPDDVLRVYRRRA